MRGLRRISTEVGLQQFVDLWTRISQVQLSQQPDTITWRFKTDGRYTAQSAYNVQFIGTSTDERWRYIWKAKVQNKCRFFIWLLLQLKLPTTDRIIKRGGKPIQFVPYVAQRPNRIYICLQITHTRQRFGKELLNGRTCRYHHRMQSACVGGGAL